MIYISGAVTNNPTYLTDFKNAEDLLRIKGYKGIINPVRITANLPKNTPYMKYINVTLECLKGCDKIFMLNGWENSKGARLEHAYAECAGMKILCEKDIVREEKKYYWYLKNFSNFKYLNYETDEKCVTINGYFENNVYKTKFTESEYKKLAKRFHFPEDMFVREEIE